MRKKSILVTFDWVEYQILKNKAKSNGINPTQYVRQSTLKRLGRVEYNEQD